MEDKISLSVTQSKKLISLAKKKQKEQIIEKQPRDGNEYVFPTSSSQRRLWFIQQMNPNSIEYNVPIAFVIKGKFIKEACQSALNEIVDRHETLRTIYREMSGEPMQVVHKDHEVCFRWVDYSNLPPSGDKERKIDEEIKEVTECPFDLVNGPLFKVIVVKVEDMKHIIAMVAHHSVLDAWSIDILKKEFEQFYLNKVNGIEAVEKPLAIQYGDYAIWQRKNMSEEKEQEKLKYWIDKLDGEIPELNLPTDFERPEIRTSNGFHYSFELTEEETSRIKERAKEQGCTLFMYLLATYQILLYHYTSQDRIVIGTTISNRPTRETENLIGFFINNLTYNTYVGDSISFHEYLSRVKQETLEMYQHQDVPFDKLVEKLHVKRDLSKTAIYQVMFNYLSASNDLQRLQSIDSEEYVLGGTKATTDINLFAWETQNHLQFNFEYSTDLFQAATIQRLAKHYYSILMAFTDNTDMNIDQVDFIDETEKEELLNREIELMKKIDTRLTITRLFEEQVERTPKNIALHYEGKQIDYETLNQKANLIAHNLIEIGVKTSDRIGLYMDRSMEMIIGMLAVMKAGGVYVPLDTTYPQERIKKIIKQSSMKEVLTQRYLLGKVPHTETVHVNCIDTMLRSSNKDKTKNLQVPVTGEDLMYILFTSGSTGEPKGVMIRHRNYVSYLFANNERLNISEPLQYMIVTTFAADLGSFCIYTPLLTGGSLHIISYERATDADWLAEYIQYNEIDVMKMVPSHFEALQVSENASNLIPKRMIIFAGEAVSKETFQKVWKFNNSCHTYNSYGPSETTVTAVACEITKEDLESMPCIPIGKPIGNTYTYVLDRQKNLVPYGVAGELYIGGEGVSAGYLGQDDITKERFIQDPFHIDSNSLIYKSGDMVRRLPDGRLVFLGRIDRQVKIRGYRIEMEAIEKVLREVDEVDEAALTIQNAGTTQYLCAYVTLHKNDESIKSIHIRNCIKNKIPDYWMPSSIVILKSIPLTVNGKIDYKALPNISLEEQMEDNYVAPRNQEEERLASIWCEALGLTRVGIDDDFFDLGGESFKAIQMIRKIGAGISVIDIFKFPTIRKLYERMIGQVKKEEGRLIRLTPQPEGPVSMTYVCFPFAGASAIAFQPLANEIPSDCQLFSCRLPGHDFTEPEDDRGTLEELVAECVAEIKEKIEGPISIYAQCVSGAVGVALAYALEAEGIELTMLFEAANFPTPCLPGRISRWWNKLFPKDRWMSDLAYREMLKSLGNADEIDNAEEEKFLINGMRLDSRRADKFFSDTYYDKDLPKLKIPICSIIGTRDRCTEYYEERYHEWEKYSDTVTLEVIEGSGHFFHKYYPKEVCGILAEKNMSQEQLRCYEEQTEITACTEEGKQGLAEKSLSMKLFAFIILGQIISILGSNLSSFAIGIWLYGDTGSIGNFSLISVSTLVPGIILAPIAGVVADRYDKRKIMILGDLGAILGTLMIFILYLNGNLKIWHICVSVVITAIGGTFQRPAFLSAIPILVPKCYLGQANGAVQFMTSSGQMLGPIIGAAVLYALGMKGVLLMDFITCFASVGSLLLVRFPERAFKKREEPFMKELVGGWRYITKRRNLVVMIIFFIVANFLMSLVTVIFSPLAIGVARKSQVGLVVSANAAGVVVGSIIMSLWGGMKRRASGMVGFLIMTSLSMILMGLRPAALLVGIALFCFGMSIAFINTHWQILIQTKVGLELQGRVFSINEMLVFMFRPFAFLLAPVFCDRVFTPFMQGHSTLSDAISNIIGKDDTRGMALYLIVIGIILLVYTILGLKYRPLHYMEDYLPDAIPGAVIYEDKDKMQELMDQLIKEK